MSSNDTSDAKRGKMQCGTVGQPNLGTLIENCEVSPFSLVFFFHGKTAKESDFNLELQSQIVLWTLGKSQIANNNNNNKSRDTEAFYL